MFTPLTNGTGLDNDVALVAVWNASPPCKCTSTVLGTVCYTHELIEVSSTEDFRWVAITKYRCVCISRSISREETVKYYKVDVGGIGLRLPAEPKNLFSKEP